MTEWVSLDRHEQVCEQLIKARQERDALRTQVKAMREALQNLIILARGAMKQANRDGAEYEIEDELAEAVAAIT